MCFAYLSLGLSLCLDQFDPRLTQLFGMGEGLQVWWLISLQLANQFNKGNMRLKRVLNQGLKTKWSFFNYFFLFFSIITRTGNFCAASSCNSYLTPLLASQHGRNLNTLSLYCEHSQYSSCSYARNCLQLWKRMEHANVRNEILA